MRFKDKFCIGAKGGHAGIKYAIVEFIEGQQVTFKFTKPAGFIGTHKLKLDPLSENQTQIYHEIDMNVKGFDIIYWFFIIKWLHDALLEDAFDKVESHFSRKVKESKYNLWVKFLRSFYKMKSIQTKYA